MSGRWRIRISVLFVAISSSVPSLAQSQGRPAKVVKPVQQGPYSCPFCDLHGHNFKGANLRNANLANANLVGADFSGANLEGAVLTGAKLKGAKFVGAVFGTSDKGTTNFTAADLTSAGFSGVALNDARFEHAVLDCAEFSGTDLSEARFGPTLRTSGSCRPKFTKATMNCEFRKDWSKAEMGGANMKCASVKSLAAASGGGTVCGAGPNTSFAPPAGLTTIYVDPSGADGATCGTSATSACQTIQAGISQCTASGGCNVLVAYGAFSPPSPIQLANNVNVYGGCQWNASGKSNSYQSLITAPAGQPGVTANGVTLTFQAFEIQGSTASTSSASIAMEATNSTISFFFDTIVAGLGGPGAPGSKGSAGTAGGNGNGGVGGTNPAYYLVGGKGGSGQYNTPNNRCGPTCGSDGCWGSSGTGNQGGAGGTPPSYYACYGFPDSLDNYNQLNGNSGAQGGTASCGGPGAASGDLFGSFSGSSWVPSNGGTGGGGDNGSGGGGGGGGGSCFYNPAGPGYDDYTGTTGGGGGAGGTGGAGGGGGQNGGASIALALISPNPATSLQDVTLVGGTGGPGGAGAQGGLGAAGGNGFSPSGSNICNTYGGNGGAGAAGSSGASAGAGAGGNGGSSILIAVQGNAGKTTASYFIGAGGSGGSGGPLQVPAPNSTCQGPQGNNGVSGTAVEVQQYN